MTSAPKAEPQLVPSDGIWVAALKEAGVAFAVAGVLLVIFYALAFRWIHPEFVPFMDREATKLIAPGKDLIPISVGGYRIEGNSAVIEDFNGDEAILALPRSFQAEDYPFIKVDLQGFTRYSKFKILWRRVDDPSQTHALEFNRSGDQVTQIAMVYGNEDYRGEIADIALLFYDGPALGFESNNEADIIINSIEFRPFSAGRVAEQVYEDWTNPPLWQGYSPNVVLGAHKRSLMSPNAISQSLVLIGFIVYLLLTARSRDPAARVKSKLSRPFVVAWLLSLGILTIETNRWQWRLAQNQDSFERYAGYPLESKIRNSALRCARFPTDCKADLLPLF